ncbi:MAG: hydroxymethylbilane synthase [Amnibacterium sp.]
MTIRLGTRGSALALAQAETVRAAIEAQGEPCELVVVRTDGDVSQASLAQIGGTGVFAGTLRRSLLAGEVDLVVHSLKDLPVLPAEGLVVAAVPERADARDALCARDGLTLDTLPSGAAVGTGSPRRRAQLIERRPDLDVRDLRGNVDTRLGHVADGRLDAVVLSLAGLTRLGRAGAVTEVLPLETWPTAAGQGALGLEIRATDAASLETDRPARVALVVRRLADPLAQAAAAAERTVLGRLEAGCVAPIGVASAIGPTTVSLWASVHEPGGGQRLDRRIDAPAGETDRVAVLTATARRLADDLLEAGAAALAPLGGPA